MNYTAIICILWKALKKKRQKVMNMTVISRDLKIVDLYTILANLILL